MERLPRFGRKPTVFFSTGKYFFNILNVYIPVYTLNICIHIQRKNSNYQIITEPDKIIFHLLYLSGDATGPQVSWENILKILKNLKKIPLSYRSSLKSKKIITHNKPNFNALATFHHLHNKQLRPGSHDPPTQL